MLKRLSMFVTIGLLWMPPAGTAQTCYQARLDNGAQCSDGRTCHDYGCQDSALWDSFCDQGSTPRNCLCPDGSSVSVMTVTSGIGGNCVGGGCFYGPVNSASALQTLKPQPSSDLAIKTEPAETTNGAQNARDIKPADGSIHEAKGPSKNLNAVFSRLERLDRVK